MPKQTFNKLVRDRIPQIIRDGGNTCETEILTDDAYLACLEEKLSEELAEYRQSGKLEELADLLEVMLALIAAKGSTWEEVTAIRMEKLEKRGGFQERILLKSVTREEV